MPAPPELKEALAERYRIEREIARGGMATVFLAHDMRHDRDVALKVMHREVGLALGRERFLREIKLAAKLSHPNILTVHDSGESGGCLWYVMPYVEGETLRQAIEKRQNLTQPETLRLMHESAEAIGYAHSMGIVHRDIKPENILLSRGHAMIADFGIARAMDLSRDDQITSSGVALGTTAYMSPEQALGENIDAASDVWALGCVMYEMLTGVPPFGAGGREVVTRALTGKREPLRKLNPHVSEQVVAIVDKALANDKHDRFANATKFAEAIDEVPSPGKATIVLRRVPPFRFDYALPIAGLIAVLVAAFALNKKTQGERALAERESSVPVVSDTVQELIRLGKTQDARRTTSGSARAIALFIQAIAQDSTVPAAWVALARATDFAYTRAFAIPGISRDSLLSLSLTASERAVALDPENANSWLVKTSAARLVDPTDAKAPLFAAQKAIALDSTSSAAWFELGRTKMDLLDSEGSYRAWKRSADLNPGDPQVLSFIALHYLWSRDYQEGLKWADSAITLDPTFRLARESKAQLLVELGRPDEAIRHYETSLRTTMGSERANALGLISRAYAMAGDSVRAREALNNALKLFDTNNPPRHEAVWVAAAVAALGDTAGAVRLLEAAQPRGDLHFQMHLKWDPALPGFAESGGAASFCLPPDSRRPVTGDRRP